MKGRVRGKTLAGVFLAGVIFFTPVPAQAGELASQGVDTISHSDTAVVPRADVIVRKYREYNGVLQYRRWNETRGYWVDSDWIDMP